MQITVNEPGARTIADSRPMQIDGERVYVVVEGDNASLIVGGRVAAERTAEGMDVTTAQAWAVEYRNEFEATVQEAVNAEWVYAAVVEDVHALAAQKSAKADELEAHGWAPYKRRNAYGRFVTFTGGDPRHPMNAAKTYRKDAALLAAWTIADEQAYIRYVDNGIADTNGHFAPLDRAAWKATQNG